MFISSYIIVLGWVVIRSDDPENIDDVCYGQVWFKL